MPASSDREYSGNKQVSNASGGTLRNRTARGVLALGFSTVMKYGLQLARMFILARLLSPKDFGVIGLSLIVINGLEIFAALGPDKYIIQKSKLDSKLVGTAWYLRAILGLIIAIFAMALAPIYAGFSNEPEVEAVLCIIAFASIAKGLKSPGLVLAERELKFKKIAIFDTVIASLELGIVSYLASSFGNVLALAWALVISSTIETVASFFVFSISERLSWHKESLWELINVGGAFIIVAIGSFIMIQGDNFMVGKIAGVTLLGYYMVAYRLCELPMNLTLQITGRAAYSAFCNVQNDIARRTYWFLAVFELQLALLIPASLAVIALANSLILTIYGSGWEAAVPCLRALGLVVFGRSLSNLIAPFLLANGHYRFTAKIKIIETLFFLLGVYIGIIEMGLVGAALGAGFGYIVAALFRLYYLVDVGQVPVSELVKRLLVAIACTLPGAVGALGCDIVLVGSPLFRLSLGLAWFVACYTSTILLFRKKLITLFVESFRSVKSNAI